MWILKKADIDLFLNKLGVLYDLFDVRDSELPPKQFLFPPQETTFIIRSGETIATTPEPARGFVLYGLTLSDLEAITYLDSLMSNPQRDYYYFKRRKQALLIGVTSEPFDVPPGGDIILSALGKDSFHAIAVTARGESVIRKTLPKLKAVKKPSSLKRGKKNKTMPELKKLFLDTEFLKDAVRWSWKGYPALWTRLGEECLGCGICTYVCPLCHCFSIEDSVDLSGKNAARCRKWDACTLPGFAKVAGGHSFHATRTERYYNWFYHKFVRAYEESGRAQCVGCGRCQENCPARIDIEEVLLDIVKQYSKQRRS